MLLRLPLLELAAQIGLGLARVFDLVAQALQMIFALGQDAALLAEPRFQVLDPAIEQFRFGGLDLKRAFELGGAGAEIAELATRRHEFGRGRLGVGALARHPVLGLGDGALIFGDAHLHRFDLGAESGDLVARLSAISVRSPSSPRSLLSSASLSARYRSASRSEPI